MKILLVNDYSGLHASLAQGLRQRGHQVVVVSDGNGWRNYPRDISIVRRSPSHLAGIGYLMRLMRLLPRFTGFDIVQLINPIFFDLKPERLFPIYSFLRRHNRKMVLGAFGEDSVWARTCVEKKPLRYSDHNIGDRVRTDAASQDLLDVWMGTSHERLNLHIAHDCDAIVSCLYEYQVCYEPLFPQKTTFIPLPIHITKPPTTAPHDKLRIFIGIDRKRSAYKGTDIMLRAAQRIVEKYPERAELRIATSVPFAQYQNMMNHSDVLLDQLYSYTPSMNSLLAMSKGIVDIGGGEPENYEIIHEELLRPIINVEPTEESVYRQLEQLVAHPERLPQLKKDSIEYVRKHHDHLLVAQQYENLYKKLLANDSHQKETQTKPNI